MAKQVNKLYRSRNDKIIAGVCGGIAEHFNVDPLWIRLFAVLLALIDGIGIVLYIIAWILMPENPAQKQGKKTMAESTVAKMTKKSEKKVRKHRGSFFFGFALIVVGAAYILRNMFDFEYVWAFVLIALGAYFLMRSLK